MTSLTVGLLPWSHNLARFDLVCLMKLSLEAADLLADFRKRKEKGSLDAEQVERPARRAADLIVSFHQERNGWERAGYPRDAVTLLCEIASDENPEVARAGVRILFPALIERLNDSFDPAACELYDRIFAQVIDFYRRLERAVDFDEALRGFGLMSESDLLGRKSSNLEPRTSNLEPRSSKSSSSRASPSARTWPSRA